MEIDRRPVRWAGLFLLAASTAIAATPFELKDGDRVVFLGGTFVEREQAYGHIEALLTARFPDRGVTFRNLGWSGDTVRGEARARFGKAADGFAHLKEHVEALKPTVLFINYGLNESFDGDAGLPEFEAGLRTLLDVLDKTGARVVLITPRRLENLGPPLPDPSAANGRLAKYVSVLKAAAGSRGYRLVDLFETSPPDPSRPWTDNGVHPTDAGYRAAAAAIARELGLDAPPVVVRAGPGGVKLARLPSPGSPTVIAVEAPGPVAIEIDGRPARLRREADATTTIVDGPDVAQADRLRAAIVAKNELYFHRWRPQNETYLFGFRKHEQGNNAREIPLFDPLVAAREAEIARLRVPMTHQYTIIRKEVGR